MEYRGVFKHSKGLSLRTVAFKFVKLKEKKDDFWMELAVGCWLASISLHEERAAFVN